MKEKKTFQGIENHFYLCCWQPAADVSCPFVKYPNHEVSPGTFWQYSSDNSQVDLSVVVPTYDAYRGGYFPKLLVQIECQDFSGYELIVVRGDPLQGRSINIGAAIARGKYLLTLDDDTSLPDTETFTKLVFIMEAYPEIGMAGGNNAVPEDASFLMRRIMKEIPRRSWKPVQEITDSDLAEHPCLIMRTEEFKEVGGENELVPRGLDPYLREEFRKLGKRIVVVPEVVYHHLPPDNLNKLLHQFYRNGRQAAYANRKYPQWVIETPKGHGSYKTQVSLLFRLFRFPMRLLYAFLTGKPIWFLCETAYALGFVRGLIFSKEIS